MSVPPFNLVEIKICRHEQRILARHAKAARKNTDDLRRSTLSLFVFRILTDYSDAAFSLDNLALFANRFY